MISLLAAVSAICLLGGACALVIGLKKTPVVESRPTQRRRETRFDGLFLGDSPTARRNRVLAIIGLAAGVLIALLSGWLIAVVVVPAAMVGVPMLLTAGDGKRTIARIEAMEEWTRSLAGVLGAGVGLEQAIQATLSRSTPEPIRQEVATLVARLRARWTTVDALRAFADDLDDATGDAIVAGLLLAADRRGQGLSVMLEGTAERAAEDVRNRRRIEADRAKPRATARYVTIITVVVLSAMVLFSGEYIAPYGTPIGQALLTVLLGAYVASLLWMRSMAKGEPAPRFLGHQTEANAATRRIVARDTKAVTS